MLNAMDTQFVFNKNILALKLRCPIQRHKLFRASFSISTSHLAQSNIKTCKSILFICTQKVCDILTFYHTLDNLSLCVRYHESSDGLPDKIHVQTLFHRSNKDDSSDPRGLTDVCVSQVELQQ